MVRPADRSAATFAVKETGVIEPSRPRLPGHHPGTDYPLPGSAVIEYTTIRRCHHHPVEYFGGSGARPPRQPQADTSDWV